MTGNYHKCPLRGFQYFVVWTKVLVRMQSGIQYMVWWLSHRVIDMPHLWEQCCVKLQSLFFKVSQKKLLQMLAYWQYVCILLGLNVFSLKCEVFLI